MNQLSSELNMARRDMERLYKGVTYAGNWRADLELDKLVILGKVAPGDRDAVLAFCLELEEGLRKY